jgi:predicted ATP-grasp superfamily ATP-dependent carboligase
VLDAFGDLDTREVAAAWRRVPVDGQWRFRSGALLAAAAALAPPSVPLVWGSGFERAPGLLARLAAGRPLWGTDPGVVRAVKDPVRFAAVARALGIRHPEVRTAPPDDWRGWLCKRAGAAGGGHVRQATARLPRGRGWYWQREVPGRAVSALVAADGSTAGTLGTSEQWTAPSPGRRYRFAGALAPARLSSTAHERLCTAAVSLAERHGIRGLASVDALVQGDEVIVLELNPRPGASLEAYERAHGANLFRIHHQACAGRLAAALPPVRAVAGAAIVHADRQGRIPADFPWPGFAADRTPGGTTLRAGAPVCTVLAEAGDAAAVRALLAARGRAVLTAIRPWACRRSSGGSPSRDGHDTIERPGAGP